MRNARLIHVSVVSLSIQRVTDCFADGVAVWGMDRAGMRVMPQRTVAKSSLFDARGVCYMNVCVCVASMCALEQCEDATREYIHYDEVGPQTTGSEAEAPSPRIMAEECNFRNENMRRECAEVNVVYDALRLLRATCLEALLGISRRQIIMWF